MLLCCASFKVQQQTQSFSFLTAIKLTAKTFYTDNLGNFYAVTPNNRLYKYGRSGALLSTLNYNYTGNITQVDASNPMEVVVFYKELNRVVFLDNNLAYRGEINLEKAGVIQAAAIARAYDNNIWVFDQGDLQLKKVTKQQVVEQMSGNIKQYHTGQTTVSFLYDNNDRVFLVDSNNGVMLFNVFASYIKTLPLKGVTEPKVLGNYFFYTKNGLLHRYNWQNAQNSSFALPDTTALLKISIEKERLYIQKTDSFFIYSY